LGDGHDYVYYGQTQFTGMHLHDQLKLSLIQQMEFNRVFAGEIFPEYYLIKIPNFDKSLRDTLDEWIYYLKTSELPEVYHAQGLDEVEKQLNIDQLDPETVVRMFKSGLDIDRIAQIQEISQAEVESILSKF